MIKENAYSIILIEDFDSSAAVTKRNSLTSIPTPKKKSIFDDDEDEQEEKQTIQPISFLSLTGILNTLDGIASLHDNIIFMTTNTIDNIDPAILRAGRCDIKLELPYLGDIEIRRFINHMYGEKDLTNYTFNEVPGCDIQAIMIDNKDDYDTFINQLIEKQIAVVGE